jgi:hypothetical protein
MYFSKLFYSSMDAFHTIPSTFNTLVSNRMKKVPMTMVTKEAFGIAGAMIGGSYGFVNSLHHRNGVVWRTSGGVALGYGTGFLCGLFPYHAFGLLVITDVGYTVHKDGVIRKDICNQ